MSTWMPIACSEAPIVLHTGSKCAGYWLGVMHRREGDFANAKYWFRRAGPHPIHEVLHLGARDMGADAALLTASSAWEPAAFVDLCAAACAGQNQATELCRKIQARE